MQTLADDLLNSLTAQVAVLDERSAVVAVNDGWRRFASEKIAACRELADNNKMSVTISAGVAEILPGEDTLDHLIRRADQALYAARNMGRNRSKISSSAP